MNTQLLNQVQTSYMKKTLPNVEVGDMVDVTTILRDNKGEKRRNQNFRGLVIAMKGSGVSCTITVRKVTDGIGVEKIFPIHSPNVENIEILKKGKVRQSKIYYMRDRIGKSAMKVADSDKEIENIQYIEEEPVKEEVEEVKDESADVEEKAVEEKKDEGEKETVEVKSEEKEEVEEVKDEKEEEKKEEK